MAITQKSWAESVQWAESRQSGLRRCFALTLSWEAWCLAHVSRSYWPHSSSAPSTLLLTSLPGRRHMGPVTEAVLCAHQTQMDPSSELGSCHWILTKGMCGKWRGSLPSLALKRSPWSSICCSDAEDLVEHSETLGEGGATQLEDVQVPGWLSEAKLFQPEPY